MNPIVLHLLFAFWGLLYPFQTQVIKHHASGGGTPAFSKSCDAGSFSATATPTCVFGSNMGANDLIWCMITWNSGTVTLSSLASTADTLTLVDNPTTFSGNRTAHGYKLVAVGGVTTVTATLSTTASGQFVCHDYSDTGGTFTLVAHAGASAASGGVANDVTIGNVTTSTANNVIISSLSELGGSGAVPTIGTGFTSRVADNNGQGYNHTEDRTVAAGTYNPAATWSGTNTVTYLLNLLVVAP